LIKSWKKESNSIISLATKDEPSLTALYQKLREHTPYILEFREPDIDNQMTAIGVFGTPEIRKMLCHLPLALKKLSQKQTVSI